MKKPFAFFMGMCFAGFLMFMLAPSILMFFIAWILPVIAFIAIMATAPRIVKVGWWAEERGNILGFIHGNDFRAYPVEFVHRGGILYPVDRNIKYIFLLDPKSTIPLVGHKSKIAWIYIDFPYALSPEYILVAYDYKLQGISNIAELLDISRYYSNLEEYRAKRDELAGLIEELEKLSSEDIKAGRVPEALRNLLPEGFGERDVMELRMLLQQRLKEMDNVIEYIETNKMADRPIAVVGARVYTVDDVLGYLMYRMPASAISTLLDLKKLEVIKRLGEGWKETAKYVVLILAIVFGSLVFIVALNTLLGGRVQTPQLPQIQSIINATKTAAKLLLGIM